jgi:hypothetical protein
MPWVDLSGQVRAGEKTVVIEHFDGARLGAGELKSSSNDAIVKVGLFARAHA